jgi:prevent-host-death family protein
VKKDVVNVHQAKTHFSKLLERAHGGEEIVLAKAGKPYARLMPLPSAEPAQRQLGSLSDMVAPIDDEALFGELPEEELRAWEDDSTA